MDKSYFLQLVFCLLGIIASAQEDTITLPLINLESSLIKIDQEPGEIMISDDKNFRLSDPLDLLNQSGTLYINRQGITGIASQNLRNVGYSRSLITWNGIPINSPRNGGLDYQLLSPSIKNIMLYDGGRSGKTSSGAIGGELALRSADNFKQGFHGSAGITYGSYDLWQGAMNTSFANDKYEGSIKANYKFANNDFKYTRPSSNFTSGQTVFKRNNSTIQGFNIHQNNSWKLNALHTIKTNVWWQQFERQIPQGISSAYRGDQQSDENIRIGITHLASFRKGVLKSIVGYLHESITYQSELVAPVPGIAQRLFIETKYHHFVNENLNFTMGISSTQDGATDLFAGTDNYNQSSILGTINYTIKDTKLSLTLRPSYIDEINHPLTGNLIWEFPAGKNIRAYLKFGREYRYPSINDSFWVGPGGISNPNLKAEKSWLQEWNMVWEKSNNTRRDEYQLRFTIFNMLVDNWIQWLQNENQLWQPQNLKKVHSRGIKLKAKIKKNIFAQHYLTLQLNYQYNPSTNTATYFNQNLIEGKQLPRSPLHHGMLALNYQFRKFSVKYNHHLTGSRFENPQNTITNPGFNFADLALVYEMPLNESMLHLGFFLNNIFNNRFEVIPNYPMPGTNFRFSLNFDF